MKEPRIISEREDWTGEVVHFEFTEDPSLGVGCFYQHKGKFYAVTDILVTGADSGKSWSVRTKRFKVAPPTSTTR